VAAFLRKPVTASVLFDTLNRIFNAEKGTNGGYIPEQPGAIHGFEGLRILLVEDNEINQELAREILEAVGITVDVAGNGLEAVAMVTSGERCYDLVFMDIQMPEMDGYEATRRIRSDSCCADLPIIAMTAHAMVEERENTRAAGMNAHITKPINLDEFFAILATWTSPVNRPASPAPSINPDRKKSGEVPLPEDLPGISVGKGLIHCSGNRELYRGLLGKFQETGSGGAAAINSLIQRGEWETAGRTAHSLKSSAANIGAVELSKAAAALEKGITAGNGDSISRLQDAFAMQLELVTCGLEQYFRTESPRERTVETARIDRDAVKGLLKSIDGLLDSDVGQALRLMKLLRKELGSSVVAGGFRRLEKDVERFDIAAARESLKILATDLELAGEERL
jgi:two-component system sensor histidine kinase/response regulator